MADEYMTKDRYVKEDYEKKDMDSGYDDDQKSGSGKGRPRPVFKRKVCRFCTQKTPIDYKNHELLRRYVTERGKILPRRITGTCAKHQRKITKAVKRARVLAYLPFVKN